MNVWLVAAAALALFTAVPLALTVRGTVEQRLVGLQALNVLVPLALVALAVAEGRSAYLDIALVAALLSLVGGLACARYVERWL